MKMNVKYYELKEQIVNTFKYLVENELSSRYGGNISIRTPDNSNHFLITASGIRKDKLTVEDIITIDFEGNVIDGDKKPSIEKHLHLEIYKARPEINAIIHAHTIFSSAFAVARVDIPPLIEEYVIQIGGEVRVADFAPAGSYDLAKNIVRSLGDRKAVLVANHGVVACGKNLEDAVNVLIAIEKTAKLAIYASVIGTVNTLPQNVVKKLREIYLNKLRDGK
ncbi:MAG: class II aldolase/adducin family protein [Candidatus Asgardarchaeia archaeon]